MNFTEKMQKAGELRAQAIDTGLQKNDGEPDKYDLAITTGIIGIMGALHDIAVILAVIADKMTEDEGEESEDA